MDNNVNQFMGIPFQNQIGLNASNSSIGCNCNGVNANINNCNCQNGQNISTPVLASNDFNTTRQEMQRNLMNYIGKQVTCEFCTCGNTVRKSGVLSCVGNDFITLTGNNGTCLLCNTEGLTFVNVCTER